MLLELRVKNLALIEKAEVSFSEGLNILTGETGAGKSIIIGSVAMALGGKASKDVIRQGAESAYIELVFAVTEPEKKKALRELEVELPEDGTLILSRRITPQRSVSKVNDETVTVGRLREITGRLIDIHGQHEHQSLLYKSKHLEILDSYAKSATEPLKEQIGRVYARYQDAKARLADMDLDQEARLRETDFLSYEIREIENAKLREGEEEELTAAYRRLQHARKIMELLSEAYRALDGDQIGRAVRGVSQAAEYDDALAQVRDQLMDAESILGDAAHGISAYMDEFTYDEETFRQIEDRLDLIHGMQARYGSSVGEILRKLEDKKARLDELENFELVKARVEKEFAQQETELDGLCSRLSSVRQEASKLLAEMIRKGLTDLNFIDVQFEMEFKRLPHYTAEGFDEAEFLISTNPGLPLRPLGSVASGGELSRVMLAIKAVLADTDDIPTLIFDEIDTGISGRTAQMVSEKLSYIAGRRQVICITHLPQIAAMADTHFEITKTAEGGSTVTRIRELTDGQSVNELARLLGGAEITETVLENAREMKKLARGRKTTR